MQKPVNRFEPDPEGNPDFVPARPPIHEKFPAILPQIFRFRRDSLSVWWEGAFHKRTMSMQLFTRQLYVANSPASVKYVMLTRNDNFERKSPQMRRALECLIGDGLFISDGDTWQTRRRIVAPIIHKNRLGSFAPIMVDTAAEMAESWASKGEGHQVDMLVEMASLTAEIISRSVFGNALGRQHAIEVIEGFTEFQKKVDQVNPGYFLGFDEGFPVFKSGRTRRAIKRVHDTVDAVIDAHERGQGSQDSLIGNLLDQTDPVTGVKISREGLRNEALTIFMAGHETTAATLTWAWYLLSQAPWVEARLHEELDRELGGRLPTLEDVRQLKYTRAIIEETLRIYPPVPILSRQAREDDEFAGTRIAAGSLVLVVPWLLHRHRLYWQRPEHFHPERFMGNRRPVPYSYIPFSTGPRICTGASFGLTEAIFCLAVLAQKFRPVMAPDRTVEAACRLTLRPRGGLPMLLRRRSATSH